MCFVSDPSTLGAGAKTRLESRFWNKEVYATFYLQALPVSLIQSLGISAAVTVFMAVAAALTLTPAALLIAPSFFTSTRYYGQ